MEFAPDRHPGLDFFRLQDDLAGVLDSEIDLVTPDGLHSLMRDRVLRDVAYA